MEMVQFHPTGMVWPPEAEGTLVTEAVRGEGGRLYNRRGERFMARYDPERMELSTRDQVALAIYREISEGRGTEHGGVWLDISHIPPSVVRERLPRMVEQFQRYGGIDITRQPVEVAPTAHYSMGGILAEPHTHSTRVPGLYAAGEVVAGIHGANRLGGNSLTDCIVFGRRVGEAASAYARQGATPLDTDQIADRMARAHDAARTGEAETLRLTEELRKVMWTRVGLIRDADGLVEVGAKIERLREQRRVLPTTSKPDGQALAAALDLDSMLLTAEATARSALLRTESRGAHQRRDFPRTDAAWQRTIVVRLGSDGLDTETEAVPSPSPQVAAALPHDGEIKVAGRLLE
jgi:succinate dehydrogenase / fumarate reductase flavoprotein subunit